MKQREIKFRYWNAVIKQMVNDPPMPYKDDWTIEQLFSDRGWVWMQFTGLTDRDGKEIYEGDIVEVEAAGKVKWRFRGVMSMSILTGLWLKVSRRAELVKDRSDYSIKVKRYMNFRVVGNIFEGTGTE